MPKEKKVSQNLVSRFTLLLNPVFRANYESHCAELEANMSARIRALMEADLEAHESNN